MRQNWFMDWRQGCWERTGAPAAKAEIMIASDWAPIRNFAPVIARDPEAVYGDLLDELRRADLRIVNLECPLTNRGAPACKSGSLLRGRPADVRALSAVPFEAATLANNHVFDYGVAGFQETCRVLRAHGIRAAGAGLTGKEACRPLRLNVKGLKLAIVNFSEGEDLTAAAAGPGVRGWKSTPSSAGARGAPTVDLVLAIGHCGLNTSPSRRRM